jgi:hypothetical protein
MERCISRRDMLSVALLLHAIIMPVHQIPLMKGMFCIILTYICRDTSMIALLLHAMIRLSVYGVPNFAHAGQHVLQGPNHSKGP